MRDRPLEPHSESSLNVWDYKPWWCQPWSIVATTVLLISGSWLCFHRLWVTILVAIPITVWMVYFIWVYPQLFREFASQDLTLHQSSESSQER